MRGDAGERWELGPESLLWRWAGDNRIGFTGLSAGLLQLMHPAVGAGVAEHSNFFDSPWDRIFRSIPAIMSVVYSDEPEAWGRRVRGFHRTIRGTDHHGRPYRALDPETFWWTHATFQWETEQVADRFSHHDLSPAERERLYQEGVEWYRRYGLTMRPVPADRAAFGAKWHAVCTEVLEMTPAAERAVDLALHRPVTDLPGMPGWSRPLQRHGITPVLRLTAIGGLPAVVRERFGIPWSLADGAALAAFERLVRRTWVLIPRASRYGPTAAEAFARVDRARGRRAA